MQGQYFAAKTIVPIWGFWNLSLISGISSGTFLDKFFTSVCEIILAFPGILLALIVAGMLGSGIFNIMISIALIGWTKYARITDHRIDLHIDRPFTDGHTKLIFRNCGRIVEIFFHYRVITLGYSFEHFIAPFLRLSQKL